MKSIGNRSKKSKKEKRNRTRYGRSEAEKEAEDALSTSDARREKKYEEKCSVIGQLNPVHDLSHNALGRIWSISRESSEVSSQSEIYPESACA